MWLRRQVWAICELLYERNRETLFRHGLYVYYIGEQAYVT